jgi:hypothetical protein
VPQATAQDRLETSALLAAALTAGGAVDEADGQNLKLRFEAFLWRISPSDLPNQARSRAAILFRRLHTELLTGKYQATCSDVAVTLDRGDFNCLTGTILFVCAARHFGLDAQALAAEGHVLCQIQGAGGDFHVETTCPRWFELSEAEAVTALR